MARKTHPTPSELLDLISHGGKTGNLSAFGGLTWRQAIAIAPLQGRAETPLDAMAQSVNDPKDWNISEALARTRHHPAAWRALRAAWTRAASCAPSLDSRLQPVAESCARLWGAAIEELCLANAANKKKKSDNIRLLENAFAEPKRSELWLAGLGASYASIARDAIEQCGSMGIKPVAVWDAAVHWRWATEVPRFTSFEQFSPCAPWVAEVHDYAPNEAPFSLDDHGETQPLRANLASLEQYGFSQVLLSRALLSESAHQRGFLRALEEAALGAAEGFRDIAEAFALPAASLGFHGSLRLAIGFESVPGQCSKDQTDTQFLGTLSLADRCVDIWRNALFQHGEPRQSAKRVAIHEWAHALDFRAGLAMSRSRGFSGTPASKRNSNPIAQLVQTLSAQGCMAESSRALDEQALAANPKHKPYWATAHEIFARAVEGALCPDIQGTQGYPDPLQSKAILDALPAIGSFAASMGIAPRRSLPKPA